MIFRPNQPTAANDELERETLARQAPHRKSNDPGQCPRRGAPVRVIAEVTDPNVIARILEHVQARGSDRKLSRQ